MNWTAFLSVVVGIGWIVEVCVAVGYSSWAHPQSHTTQRNWMYALLVVLTLLSAILVGVSA